MYYCNGFVCGGKPSETIKVERVKALPDQILLITFNNGEERLFDASILTGEVFQCLKDENIFKCPEIDHGVVTWDNGEVDCAPEFMYRNSFEYAQVI